ATAGAVRLVRRCPGCAGAVRDPRVLNTRRGRVDRRRAAHTGLVLDSLTTAPDPAGFVRLPRAVRIRLLDPPGTPRAAAPSNPTAARGMPLESPIRCAAGFSRIGAQNRAARSRSRTPWRRPGRLAATRAWDAARSARPVPRTRPPHLGVRASWSRRDPPRRKTPAAHHAAGRARQMHPGPPRPRG